MTNRLARMAVVMSLTVGALSAAAEFADATPSGIGAAGQDVTKVDTPIDENDPQVINARSIQLLENKLAKLVEASPEIYAGLGVDESGYLIVRIKDGINASASIRAVSDTVEASGRPTRSATVVTAPRSATEMRLLHSQVDALLEEMDDAGADIAGTGPDMRTGKIQIDIVSGQAAAEKVLGPLAENVQFVTSIVRVPKGGGGALTLGRYSDVAPWYGADGIYMSNGGSCTAGYPVTKNGIRYMMTAGHCVDINGTQVSAAVDGVNGTWPSGFYSGSTRTYMGHSSQTEFSTQLDSSLISGSYGPNIWIGGTTTTTSWPVLGATPSEPVGTAVCHGGAVSGQQCRYAINISPYTWHYESNTCGVKDAYLYNMVKAIGNYSGVMHGDSGGPVYTRSPSGAEAVYVRGTISGNGCNTDLVYEPFYRTNALFANGGLTSP